MQIKPINYQNFSLSFSKTFQQKPSEGLKQDTYVSAAQREVINNAEILYENINKQFDVITPADVENIVSTVCHKTGADRNLVLSVMGRLCSFSSYSQLEKLADIFKLSGAKFYAFDNTPYNAMFAYLFNSKNYFNACCQSAKGQGIILDENFLSPENAESREKMLEVCKRNKNAYTFFVIDGWNVLDDKTGKYLSNSLFNISDNLEYLVENTVLKIQSGKTADEALNGDIIKQAKEVLGDDVKIEVIKNYDAYNLNSYQISKLLRPIMPDKEEVKSAVDIIGIYVLKEKDYLKRMELEKFLYKFFNRMMVCYDAKRLTKELREKYKEIEEEVKKSSKTMDDVLYAIPEFDSSLGFITNQFVIVNNIPTNKIIDYDGSTPTKQIEDKIVVILDDFVGTGSTLTSDCFSYLEHELAVCDKKINAQIIFAPLVGLKSGIDKIQEGIDETELDDKILCDNIINPQNGLDEEDLSKIERLFKRNPKYGVSYSCVAMPYMLPDNNSNVSSLFLSLFLPEITLCTNKYLNDSIEMDWYKTLLRKIRTDDGRNMKPFWIKG